MLFLSFLYWRKQQANRKPTGPLTIVHWGFASDQTYYQTLIDSFQTLNPDIKVVYQAESREDYRERLQTALMSKSGPDTFQFHHTWGIMLGSLLSPLPPSLFPGNTYDSLFYPVNQTWLKNSNGQYLGLPLQFDSLGLFYNRTLLQGAGISPPTTWAQLQAAASALTIKNEAKILRGGVALGTTNNVAYWPDIIGALMFQNNADPQKPNTEAGQEVLTFYTGFTTKEKLWDSSLPDSTYAFANEKVAFMIAPSYVVNEVYALNPNLNFAVVPLPQPPYSESAWATYWAIGISKNTSSAKQQASHKWLSFLLDKESLRQLYAQKSAANLVGSPFPRVDMADQLVADPFVGAYITQAPQGRSWYLCSHTNDNGVNDKIINIYQTAIDSVLAGDPPSEALASAEDDIQAVLSSYVRRR